MTNTTKPQTGILRRDFKREMELLALQLDPDPDLIRRMKNTLAQLQKSYEEQQEAYRKNQNT
jgi:hypothetical protein